jgi:hypothetical protein
LKTLTSIFECHHIEFDKAKEMTQPNNNQISQKGLSQRFNTFKVGLFTGFIVSALIIGGAGHLLINVVLLLLEIILLGKSVHLLLKLM